MKTVSLRLRDGEVAGLEAYMQKHGRHTQTDVIRIALRALFKAEGIDTAKELREKSEREAKERYQGGRRRT